MVSHLVLFRPPADLAPEHRERFVQALERALSGIPAISRATLGRRVVLGQRYDALVTEHYEYVAILEFADEAGLRSYLEHPAHADLGRLFYELAAAAVAYDFETVDGSEARRLVPQA